MQIVVLSNPFYRHISKMMEADSGNAYTTHLQENCNLTPYTHGGGTFTTCIHVWGDIFLSTVFMV